MNPWGWNFSMCFHHIWNVNISFLEQSEYWWSGERKGYQGIITRQDLSSVHQFCTAGVQWLDMDRGIDMTSPWQPYQVAQLAPKARELPHWGMRVDAAMTALIIATRTCTHTHKVSVSSVYLSHGEILFWKSYSLLLQWGRTFCILHQKSQKTFY